MAHHVSPDCGIMEHTGIHVAKGEDVNVMPTQNPCVLTPQPKYVFELFYVSSAQIPKAGVWEVAEKQRKVQFSSILAHVLQLQ